MRNFWTCLGFLGVFFVGMTFGAGEFDGPYLGADLGAAQGIFRGTENATVPGLLDSPSLSIVNQNVISDVGGTGGLQAGYGWQQRGVFWGVFAQGDFYGLGGHSLVQSTPISNTVFNLQPNVKQISLSSALSMGIKPGILLSPVSLLFFQVAASYANAHLNTSLSSATEDLPITTNSESSAGLWGVRLGLGLEQKLSQHLSLFLNYLYSNYGHINADVQSSTTLQDHVNYDVQENLYLLGLNYYFYNSSAFKTLSEASSLFEGFYLGLFGGYQVIESKETYTDIQPILITMLLGASLYLTQTVSDHLVSQNFVGGALAGYNFSLNRWVLGLLVDSDFAVRYRMPSSNYTQSSAGTISQINTSVTEQDYFGFYLNPGFLLTPSNLLFSRLGIVDANFTLTASTGFLSLNQSINQLGYRFGLGIEHRFPGRVSLYLLDQYTLFPTASAGFSTEFETIRLEESVNNNQALVGVNWYF